MILVIDNYDSFTFNLVHYLGELGAECDVRRNDALSADEALALRPEAIVLSPGPCTPDEAGICCDLIAAVATQPRPVPLLGVCLGHQAIGQVFGGAVVRTTPMHGKTSPVRHDGTGVFAGLPSPYLATRYHSLIVRRDDLPETLVANAELADGQGAGEAVGEGIVMGLRHRTLPIHGVQFHPESIASEHGHALLENFLRLARAARLVEAA